jgi:hypothetical protein
VDLVYCLPAMPSSAKGGPRDISKTVVVALALLARLNAAKDSALLLLILILILIWLAAVFSASHGIIYWINQCVTM